MPGARLSQINGMAPSLSGRVPGCAFAPRCMRATPQCVTDQPPVTTIPGREFRCFVPLEAHAA
jgi:peptide/nickel transport system ATP-binding protein